MARIGVTEIELEPDDRIENAIACGPALLVEIRHANPRPPKPHARVEIYLNGNKCAEFPRHECRDNLEAVAQVIEAFMHVTRTR